jgi:PAS domain S-box-containing protein
MKEIQSEMNLRKTAEASLADSEEVFRLLVDAVEDYAIFVLDSSGVILTWNLGAQRLKGYQPEEIIGSHFSCFYTQPDIDRHHPEYELRMAEKTGKYEEEGWRVRKDGTTFWANVTITALRDHEGRLRGFGKVTRDLSERKKAEDDLRQAYAQLETRIEERTQELSQAKVRAENAVKARDQFFSIASHELKTPLTSLKMQVQLRKRSIAKGDFSDFAPEKLAELCDDDERLIARLSFLVENMLDVSRLTSGNFQLTFSDVELTELVHETVKRMGPILKEAGIDCRIDPLGATRGRWDRHRLEQVITNLLSNAAKYAPGRPVEITLTQEADRVKLSVRDHGKGISKTARRRIFLPFERLRDEDGAGGLGLGLYIIKQIVDAHHGFVFVESEPGDGSTFIVDLPVNAEVATGNSNER